MVESTRDDTPKSGMLGRKRIPFKTKDYLKPSSLGGIKNNSQTQKNMYSSVIQNNQTFGRLPIDDSYRQMASPRFNQQQQQHSYHHHSRTPHQYVSIH